MPSTTVLPQARDLVHGHVGDFLKPSRGPADLYRIDGGLASEAEMHRTRGAGGVTHAPGSKGLLRPLRRLDAQCRTQNVAVGLNALQFDRRPVMLVGAVVDPELGWPSERRDHEIEAPSAVTVTRHSAALATRCNRCEAGSFGDPLEGPDPN